MYRSSPSTSPHDKFLDQFDWDGGDWLYRHRMTGAAYRVTDREKDAFVAAFDRQQRWLGWIGLAIFLPFMLWLIWATYFAALGDSQKELRAIAMVSVWPLVFTSRFAIDHFTFRAPLRSLAQREPVAPGWSKEERRRLALGRIPAELLLGGLVVCPILLAVFFVEGGLTSVIGRFFIVVFIAILLWAAVTGYRKWQFARADAAITSPTS